VPDLGCGGLDWQVFMPLTYNIKDAAERMGVSKQWLRKFLRQHPVDQSGIPFYVPFGNRKRFTERDLERILEVNREAEKERLLSRASSYPSLVPPQRDEQISREEFLSGDRLLARVLTQIKK
jgi:helix-turn-helix protein